MVTAKGRNSSPAIPPTRATGANTATVARVEEVMAVATSAVPSRMARFFPTSAARWRLMFSTTTMESSTTRPIEMVSAPRVSMFKE